MLNGRLGKNNFTDVNGNGSSVMDYMIVPHEQLERYQWFKVHTMSYEHAGSYQKSRTL